MSASLHLRKGASTALAIALLVVAVLAAGGRPSRGARGPELSPAARTAIADLALLALGLVLTAGLAVVAVSLPRPHRRPRDPRLPRIVRRRGGAFVLVLAVAVLTPAVIVAVRAAGGPTHPTPAGVSRPTAPAARTPSGHGSDGSPASPVWLGAGVLAAAAVLLVVMAPRRHARVAGRHAEPPAARDLKAPSDRWPEEPRDVVLEAYHRSEACLSRAGLARHAPEPPREFLRRLAGQPVVDRAAAAQLTGLYEQARYSRHPISPPMSAAARDAYDRLREGLVRSC